MWKDEKPTAPPYRASETNVPLRIGYILSYRDPNYTRTQSILSALGNVPGVRVVTAINSSKGLQRYVETWRALRRIRETEKPDVYILGFRGHEIFWPVQHMAKGAPVIFDALMSPYAALHEDKKAGPIGKLLAPLIYYFERKLLRRADLVLTDTQLHSEYFAHTFSIPVTKIRHLPVGAIEPKSNARPCSALVGNPFTVLFYGSFLPLHGVNVIVDAASRLTDLPILFDFVGGSAKQSKKLRLLCKRANVTRYTHRHWVPFEQLLNTEIPRASLCLGGPFGGTPQAKRVVTGKASQCLALAKATVIGRIDEDYGFVDRTNCLLVDQGDAKKLAEVIRWAYENRSDLASIGTQGRALYEERLSTSVITNQLAQIFHRAILSTLVGAPP